ncbi:hypothetical protein J5N97_013136 [Dioscorea zingiberensis]|uniref:Inositol polyphosphate-related phosphatase domain-containing protein n=1 Tax=Dioscorea zingiberensis TaxID=325984 RepID=A0A9D5CRL1_9LILI|nr:hypothetical protein J5N97_013136 [Dioscorea zingiberensis]
MVYVFLCVWVRLDLLPHVLELRVSSVGTGIMGYTWEISKVIWLGDLNYHLTTSRNDTQEQLVLRNDWQALLEKDQLRIEQKAGRVFTGWKEGRIYFPPTYKYLANSDNYVVNVAKSREIKRNPA